MQTKKIFEEVSPRMHPPDLEREVMETWREGRTFEKSLARRADSPTWIFYEGPPTANGKPGTHHILARAFKDLFPRYRTMKGFYVERKAGWDTHGLPVEIEIEKKLGISGKQQIEEFGIEKFNELCRRSVYEYVDDWRAFSERMAFWQDYDDAYWTLTPDYIQSVWWALKTMWERGLIYKGFRVAPYCPRCATPLSSHELAQGWQEDTPDPSIYVRFRLKSDPGTSLLAWTTTPWTLPGNVALAVGEDVDYVKVNQGAEHLVLAEARLGILDGEYEVVERLKGRDLLDLEYEPLYSYMLPKERAFFVVSADFVSTEDGTGIVHTAAAYGADDLRLSQEKGIPVRHTVDLRGRFFPEVEKFAGIFVKDADPLIIEDLKERGLLYRAEEIRHTYPFCWRCRTPLLYYALDSWYIRTTEMKEQLLANNKATNWVPAHVKTGRMGDWLENNVDWAFSRTRYWGTPLPFWVCEGCQETRVVSTTEELGLAADADLHRPYIDEVKLTCEGCGGEMSRVPEVLDTWFDSGSMPFAQRGYPKKGQREFEQSFPADFICEALDQTRGWFYSLLAISTLLFGQNAYRNVICLGLVLDPRGQKSSKSRGNVLDPNFLFDTFGADAVRWFYYTSSAVGENYRTGTGALQEVVRQFLLTLWNVYSFFVTYANIDGFAPDREGSVPLVDRPVLDRWLLSRLSRLVDQVDSALDRYDVNGAARPIQAFVEDLSNWYVRRSRRRFWKSESDTDKLAAYQTLYQTLITLVRLLGPFTPFLAEAIHRNLCRGESVHLADFPSGDPTARDVELETEMALAREDVAAGLAARDRGRLKVRQPLRSVTVTHEFQAEVAAIIREELNVKEVRTASEFSLDVEVTEELRMEGMAREAVRCIQDRRKRSALNIEDRIVLFYEARDDWRRVFERFGDYIAAETLAREMRAERPDGLEGAACEEGLWIGLRRVS
jgi:isoleucyl-tRNA synthetase